MFDLINEYSNKTKTYEFLIPFWQRDNPSKQIDVEVVYLDEEILFSVEIGSWLTNFRKSSSVFIASSMDSNLLHSSDLLSGIHDLFDVA